MCLWMFFVLNRFEDVESRNIHRSFVGWTGRSSALFNFRRLRGFGLSADGPGKAAWQATRRCTGRQPTATSRLRSFCSPKVPRWTPRTTMARGLKVMGSRAQKSSLRFGAPQKVFRAWNSWILRTIDALNIKGLQHLLVNVVVLLDLNFQTAHEFAPAMRGK